jgi:shikimate kinase
MKIFLMGFMGSGKTHWGRQLSKKLEFPFFDLDEMIMRLANKSITEIFEQDGEEKFRTLEKEALYMITEGHDKFILACGGTPCFFNNIDYMNQSGITVWINTPSEILLDRLIKEKSKRPLIKNLNEEQLYAFILKKWLTEKYFMNRQK